MYLKVGEADWERWHAASSSIPKPPCDWHDVYSAVYVNIYISETDECVRKGLGARANKHR